MEMPVGAFCAFLGFCRLVRYFTLFLGHAGKCVFKGMMDTESPLNTDLWDFYALCSEALGGSVSGSGYVTLLVLMGLNPVWSDYYGIGDAIKKALTAR